MQKYPKLICINFKWKKVFQNEKRYTMDRGKINTYKAGTFEGLQVV